MTQNTALLTPMLGMVFLTFSIMIWMLKLRFRAIKNDRVNPRYFSLNKGAKLPDYLLKVTQHYENLLEMPILFYISILMVIALNLTNTSYVILAWLFLFFRVIHTIIHTTYNKVTHRKNAFIISTLILILLWLNLTVDIITQN